MVGTVLIIQDGIEVSTNAARVLPVEQKLRNDYSRIFFSISFGHRVTTRRKIEVTKSDTTNIKDNGSAFGIKENIGRGEVRLDDGGCSILVGSIVGDNVETRRYSIKAEKDSSTILISWRCNMSKLSLIIKDSI